MPMPKLVPSMEYGILSKWLVDVGQEIQVIRASLCPFKAPPNPAPAIRQVGDLVCECAVERLIDTEGPGVTTMLIESHERGYVAKLFVAEGAAVPVDSCIAVLVEEPQHIPALAHHTPPRPSANSGAGPGRMFCWQAYLKTEPHAS